MIDFETAVKKLREKIETITDRECLAEYAIDCINNGDEFLAIHVLEALKFNNYQYFDYDYSMGTLDTPTPLQTIEDLKDYLQEVKMKSREELLRECIDAAISEWRNTDGDISFCEAFDNKIKSDVNFPVGYKYRYEILDDYVTVAYLDEEGEIKMFETRF